MADERQYRGQRSAPPAVVLFPALRPPPELSDADRERITGVIAFAKENLPGLRELVKDLVDAGCIHGWRNVFITKREKNETV
jgi:hypothetical protein